MLVVELNNRLLFIPGIAIVIDTSVTMVRDLLQLFMMKRVTLTSRPT